LPSQGATKEELAVTYYLELEENLKGRDFIFGDLHGCLPLLKEKLTKAGFNPQKDRLFSVGDLTDRGPQSYESLELLEKDWFYSVVGNHDDMLLGWLGRRHFSYMDRETLVYPGNGGEWVEQLGNEQMSYLREIVAPALERRPYVIHVKGKRPFNVLHAEVYTAHRTELGYLTDEELADESMLAQAKELLTWGRQLYSQKILKSRKLTVCDDRFIDIGGDHVEGLSPTYVGHSICPCPVRYSNHFFLDGGAYMSYWPKEKRLRLGQKPFGTLFMYNHTEKKFV
jgi:serine/threonine protein phosphatase 1